MTTRADQPVPAAEVPRLSPGTLARLGAGGALMGLANLVPGISGGTMLVAAGVYARFIDAVADATRLRLGRGTVVTLAVVVLAAAAAIGGGAGAVSFGLERARWAMYSLFIGLTLGGAPLLVRMLRPFTPAAWLGAFFGAAGMLGLALAQEAGAGGSAGGGALVLFVAGVAGASAMILPGVSGAYLLLLLGQYEAVVGAIKDFVRAAADADLPTAAGHLGVLLPVGVGVLVGIAAVGNALKFLLHRYEKATVGVLLGLLLAAPAGLYPFKAAERPRVGDVIGGVPVTDENAADLDDPKDWPEHRFDPTPAQIAGSLGLAALGFGLTFGLSRLGGGRAGGRRSGTGGGPPEEPRG